MRTHAATCVYMHTFGRHRDGVLEKHKFDATVDTKAVPSVRKANKRLNSVEIY